MIAIRITIKTSQFENVPKDSYFILRQIHTHFVTRFLQPHLEESIGEDQFETIYRRLGSSCHHHGLIDGSTDGRMDGCARDVTDNTPHGFRSGSGQDSTAQHNTNNVRCRQTEGTRGVHIVVRFVTGPKRFGRLPMANCTSLRSDASRLVVSPRRTECFFFTGSTGQRHCGTARRWMRAWRSHR